MKRIVRDTTHRKFINSLPCATCFSNPPSQCSHIRRQHDGGTGLKPSDFLTIPQCAKCHAQVDFIITSDNCTEFKTLANSLYAISGNWKEAVKLVLEFRRR